MKLSRVKQGRNCSEGLEELPMIFQVLFLLKRIGIHNDLIAYLEQFLTIVKVLMNDNIFLIQMNFFI